MGRVTIQDVAKLAGVSSATISHVINGTRYVSDETRKAVQDAIDELSYVPNLAARNLKTGKKNLIGFITPDLTNSYFSNIIEEAEAVIRAAGYSLLISNSKEIPAKEYQALQYLCAGMVDGIVCISSLLDFGEIRKAVPESIPIVLIDRELDHCECDTITVATYDSICEVTTRIIRSGRHKRIGYIASADELKTTKERLKAFQDTLVAEAFPPEDALVLHEDSTADSKGDAAYTAVSQMLDSGATAIIVSTNVITQHALRCLSDRGLDPARDVELVGFFNHPYTYPCRGMSWIDMPGRTLGAKAGKTIIERIEQPQAPFVHEQLASVVRVNQ